MQYIRRESGNPTQPSADVALRRLIAGVIKASPKSREQIADEMSLRLGMRVTAGMLRDFTAESKGKARFPAVWIPLFCDILGDDSLQRELLGPRLRQLLALAEADLAHIQEGRRLEALRQRLLAEKRQ